MRNPQQLTLWPVRRRLCAVLACCVVSIPALGAVCDNRTEHRRAFFGDLHVHTRYSLDAATQGTVTTPAEAYRFARGEPLGIQPWDESGRATRQLQLDRPLDFAMVSDHAELMGEVETCSTAGQAGHDAWQCDLFRTWPRAAYYWFNLWSSQFADRVGFCDGGACAAAALGPWADIRSAAADANAPCEFTTFVGYEWTGGYNDLGAGNLHRNVVFASGEVPPAPISFIDEPTASGLYTALDETCQGACQAVVIPHNSNLSAGTMFRNDLDSAAAEQRQRFERLAEIMQHKGASECYYNPLGADELCAFEQLQRRSFTSLGAPRPGDGFLRSALLDGLNYSSRGLANPFQFGFVGSSDTHLGTPGAVAETGFPGHGGAGLPARDAVPPGLSERPSYNPGGLAVLWAEENSRAALFAAMQRREAYGTSGPRITARLFAGWQLPEDLCDRKDFASLGYANGVPMGGELSAVNQTAGPEIAVAAQRDALSEPLERIQIIKGWLDGDGDTHTRVYDVALADQPGQVDPATCHTNGGGAARLCTVWRDPNFDPAARSWYYARVVESPSCRWSQRQCLAAGVDCNNPASISPGFGACCAKAHRPIIRERAWTSPVWYSP